MDHKDMAERFQPYWDPVVKTPCGIILGEQALNRITGEKDLSRWRGRQITRNGQFFYPTLVPENMLPHHHADDPDEEDDDGLQHSPTRFQGVWCWDVQQAFAQRSRLRPQPPMTSYVWDPTPSVWRELVSRLLIGPRLSVDIETAYKMSKMDDEEWEAQGLKDGQVLRISFCAVAGVACSVSWTAQYMEGIKQLLASTMPKVGWNIFHFDIPKLENENVTVNGDILDYQDAWHMVESDLPKGLEWVTSFYTTFHPWKHLAQSQPGLYSCIDADAALQCANGIDADLERHGMTDLFRRHVVELMPIMRAAGRRGNLIDMDYSKALEAEMIPLKEKLIADSQSMVPEDIFPRARYKREPEPEQGRTFVSVTVPGEIKQCSHCHESVGNMAEHLKGRKKGTKADPDNYNRCKAVNAKAIKVPGNVVEWDEILPFNPNSADQLKAYIRHFGHPMGKNRQTDNDSANSKHLKKLAKKYGTKHPIYPLVIELKKLAKTISTYIYHPRVDDNKLIHSTYVNAPSTWRFAARDENLTNVGKREENPWTKRARRQIIARPGHVFVGADSTSIEAIIVGYLIGDEQFMRMAAKSIHAWLACQDLGWEFNDTTMERVKADHKDLYGKMKTAIYLLLYGGDPYLMHMENPENFPTRADAQIVQDKIFNLVPKLAEWQERTRDRAKKEGTLTSLWGYRHSFYDVYTFKKNKFGILEYHEDGRPKLKLGKDSKRGLAFDPQNCAAAFGRDTLHIMGHGPWFPYMGANCFVHDGYTLEVLEQDAYDAESYLVDILTRSVPQLGGMRIGCETEIGKNWAEVDPKCKFWADGNPDGMKTIRKVEV